MQVKQVASDTLLVLTAFVAIYSLLSLVSYLNFLVAGFVITLMMVGHFVGLALGYLANTNISPKELTEIQQEFTREELSGNIFASTVLAFIVGTALYCLKQFALLLF